MDGASSGMGLESAGDGQFDDEAAAARDGLEAKLAAVAAHDGAGDEEAEAGDVGSVLEGLEQVPGVGDAGAGVVEGDEHAAAARGDGDGEMPRGAGLDGAMAILRQVHEDLHEAVAVGKDAQGGIGDGPGDGAADFGPAGLDDDAEVVEDLLEGDIAGVAAGAVELEGGEASQTFDESFEALDFLDAAGALAGLEVGVDDGDGAAEIADFVEHGGDDEAAVGGQLLHVVLFAVAHLLGGIDDDGGELRALGRGVGGEPEVGEEGFPVQLAAERLGGGAEGLAAGADAKGSGEDGHERMNGAAFEQFAGRDAEQHAGGAVGGDDAAGAIEGKDGGGAAFDKDPETLLGFVAEALLIGELGEVAERHLAVADDGDDEEAGNQIAQAGAEEADRVLEKEVGIVEGAAQERADDRKDDDAPAGEDRGGEEHGKDVEAAEREAADAPVREGGGGGENKRGRENAAAVGIEDAGDEPAGMQLFRDGYGKHSCDYDPPIIMPEAARQPKVWPAQPKVWSVGRRRERKLEDAAGATAAPQPGERRKMNAKVLAGAALCGTLIATGCATKKYVAKTVAPVEARVSTAETKNADQDKRIEGNTTQITELGRDLSRTRERLTDTDQKATAAAAAAKTADQKADDAKRVADGATSAAALARAASENLARNVDAMNRWKVEKSETVLFPVNRWTLAADAKTQLDGVCQAAKGKERYSVEVQGFTDKTGTAAGNEILSQRRAQEVARYLVNDCQVPLHDLSILGSGYAKPVGDDKTRDGRKQNRRVEIRLLTPERATATETAAR